MTKLYIFRITGGFRIFLLVSIAGLLICIPNGGYCGVPLNPPRDEIKIEIDADCNNNNYLAADPFPDGPVPPVPDDPESDLGFETRDPAKIISFGGSRIPARIAWKPVGGSGLIRLYSDPISGDIDIYSTNGVLLVASGGCYEFSASSADNPLTVMVEGTSVGCAYARVEYVWNGSSVKSDKVRFTVLQLDLVSFQGDPVRSISESTEEDPGAYVGWNADGSDRLVKLELRCYPPLPSSYTLDCRLQVASVGYGDGRIRIWEQNSTNGTPLINGTGQKLLNFDDGSTLLDTLYVEGRDMSSEAMDVEVSFWRDGYSAEADKVRFTIPGIQPVKSRDEYETKLDFVPLVRKSFEIETIADVRDKATNMSWSVYLFQVGVGAEAGAKIESYDIHDRFLDLEYGQNYNGLNVEEVTSAHYAGWDASQSPPDQQCGYVVDDVSLKNEIDTIQGEEDGTIWLRSTEAVTANQIKDFGNNKTEVLASNLILRNVDDSSADERFEIYVVENDDDDDNNNLPDNDDTAITGTIAQKAEDRDEMGLLTIKELTPSAARTSSATFILKQENAGETGAGKINLFRVDDDSLFWTSGSSETNLVDEWDSDLELRVEGVERGEVILCIEYEGNDVEWFDKAKITVVSLDIAMDGNRDGIIEFDKHEDQEYLFWVNDDWDKKELSVHDWRDVEDDSIEDNAKRNCDDDTIGFERRVGINSCKRDLEDFTVVDIMVDAAFTNLTDVTYWLRLDAEQWSPAVNFFEAATNHNDYTNAFDYLSVLGVANEQIKKKRICTVDMLEREIDAACIHPGEISRFLLEGKQKGKGDLRFVIRIDGKEACARTVKLDLQPIAHFYDIYKIGGAQTALARWNVQVNPYANHVQRMTAYPANDKYLLIVHGWNMNPKSKHRLAETAFKRLWWQSYKGKLGLFAWPTLYDSFVSEESDVLHHYDNSEMIAWLSSRALAKLLTKLNANGELRVLAHSMGNVVTGEALRKYQGNKINTYIATQAALSAHAYDNSAAPHEEPLWATPSTINTPNLYGYWHSGNTNSTDNPYLFGNSLKVNANQMFNYYNRDDWALDKWAGNNILKPDDSWGYRFDYDDHDSITNYVEDVNEFYRKYGWFSKQTLSVTNLLQRYQILAYCLESHSLALGQTRNITFGGTNNNWNLQDSEENGGMEYGGVHYYHSKQWRSNIVDEKKYYERLINDAVLK